MKLGRLAKGTLIYGLGGALSRLITLLTLPLFTAYLTPHEYGVSSQLTILAAFLAPLFTLGLGTSVAQVYFEHEATEHRSQTVWTAFWLLLASALVLLAITWFAAPWAAQALLGDAAYGKLVWLTAGTIALSMVTQPFNMDLQFKERAAAFVTVSNAVGIATVLTNAVLVVGFGLGVLGIVLGNLIGQFLAFVLFLAASGAGGWRTFRGSQARELVRLGIPMVPSFGSLYLVQFANRYILQWQADLGAVGIYTIGFSLGMAMALAVSAFQSAWTPYFMAQFQSPRDAEILFGRVMRYYVLGFGLLAFAFFALARPVTSLLTQPAFHSAYQVVGLTALSQFFWGMFLVLLPSCYYARDVKASGLVQAVAAALSLVGNYFLIGAWGIAGAGLGLAAGYGAMALGMYVWNHLRRRSALDVQYRWLRVLPFGLVAGMLAAALTAGPSAGLIAEIGLGAAALMIVTLVAYRTLDPWERTALRARLLVK
ncbi:MAG: oligosaccharide flippase family protein [Candidatus Sericytochromatia bacterium]|nr:oligosaccharide flippase family protein [Candidatus Tanganyikabacteria bacterium]